MNKSLPHPDYLPSGISIRPAAAEDERAIRAIVRGEGLNPLSLHWWNFLLAEDSQTKIVGIGAVKRHGDGSRELASIAVLPEWRGRGVAGGIIRVLLARESSANAGGESSAVAGNEGGSLYLTCRDTMTGFYERFGFRAIGITEMTPYFRRLYRIFSFATGLLRTRRRLVVMERKS